MNQDEQPQTDQEPPVPGPVPAPLPDQGAPTPSQEPALEVRQPEPINPFTSEAPAAPGAPTPPHPTATPVAPPPRPTDRAPSKTTEPRNFLVAMLMIISFGFFGLHQVYLGKKTQGWVRFALAILAYPLMLVLVGYLIMIVLAIWTVVDFFTLYLGKRIDADGQPLTTTSRDSAWSKTIFIVSLVVGALYTLLVVLGIIFVMATGLIADRYNSTPSDLDYYSSDSSY